MLRQVYSLGKKWSTCFPLKKSKALLTPNVQTNGCILNIKHISVTIIILLILLWHQATKTDVILMFSKYTKTQGLLGSNLSSQCSIRLQTAIGRDLHANSNGRLTADIVTWLRFNIEMKSFHLATEGCFVFSLLGRELHHRGRSKVRQNLGSELSS